MLCKLVSEWNIISAAFYIFSYVDSWLKALRKNQENRRSKLYCTYDVFVFLKVIPKAKVISAAANQIRMIKWRTRKIVNIFSYREIVSLNKLVDCRYRQGSYVKDREAFFELEELCKAFLGMVNRLW